MDIDWGDNGVYYKPNTDEYDMLLANPPRTRMEIEKKKPTKSWWTKGHRQKKSEIITEAQRRDSRNYYRKTSNYPRYSQEYQKQKPNWSDNDYKYAAAAKRRAEARERIKKRDEFAKQHDFISLGNGQVKYIKKKSPVAKMPRNQWDMYNVYKVYGVGGDMHYENREGKICYPNGEPIVMVPKDLQEKIARNKLAAQIRRRKSIAKKKLMQNGWKPKVNKGFY